VPSLLFLTQRIPYPPIKGEKIRPLQILKHLRTKYDVHLGCLIDDLRDLEHVPSVQALCSDSYFATLDRRRARIRCLRGLLTNEPLSVTFYHDSGLAGWVRRVLREVKPEVIFVCSSNMAPYVLALRGRERVCLVDLADVDSEKWHAYAETGSFPMSWLHGREWRRVADLESRIARDCDWSTFVSDAEASLFANLHPDQSDKIRAVSSGVDHTYFDPQNRFDAPFDTGRLNFVFTGTMDYPPNVDAVTWFAEAILPIIRRSAADAAFHVVGSNPSAAVQALAGIGGVFVTGRVPDVRPYMSRASAGVAPMRIARGIQNKVLEAMAMARPTVVTTGALTGIAAIPGREVLLADSAETFAAACLEAAGPAGSAIGQAARQRVLREYVWAERLRGFDPLLDGTPQAITVPVTVP
jgi:sugar transferase (PEP-CTERM/EpsH1 system associated)